MPITVNYDVQILGLAMRTNNARAGIARVVDHVARGITAAPDCHVRFCNAGPWDLHRACLRYLREVCRFDEAQLSPPGVFGLGHQLGERGHVQHRRLSTRRVVRAFAAPAHAALQARYARRLAAFAGTADIYHSPFDPLPADLDAGGGRDGPARFLTVYDLIPVRHPEWFDVTEGNAIVPAFLRVMGSLRPTDYVHCISESTRADLLNHLPHLDPDRVFVSLLAADTDVFRPCDDPDARRAVRAKYGLGDRPYVLSVCTLEPRKNLDSVIRAFARVAAEPGLADLRLVLVGGRGWNTATIDAALAAAAACRDRVVITGYVPDADLSPLYSDAAVFAYPSRYEGFGLPALEAMACGVPVVTSNVSSLPEVVADAALTVDPDDLDGLAQAILTVVTDAARRADMGRRSLARAATFSWDRCVGRIVDQYRRAAADRGHRS